MAALSNFFQPTPQFYLCPGEKAAGLYKDITEPGGENGDSGTDLRFAADCIIPPSGVAVVGLDVRARLRGHNHFHPSTSPGFVAFQIVPRSSISKTPLGLANSVGTIDAGYTGELKVAIRNYSADEWSIARGTALFQLVTGDLSPAYVQVVGPQHPVFDQTKRGAGGFGSTGKGGVGGAADAETAAKK